MRILTRAVLITGLLLIGETSTIGKNLEGFSPRLTVPRMTPIGKENRTPDQEKMLSSRPDFNIYKTLAHHPELYARWSGLGQYLLNGSTLPARDREIVILRMGWLCQAPYEWSQHARIAQADAGLTSAEVHRVAEGPTAKGWSDFERTLLSMVDELRYDTQIGDATWQALRAKYSLEQTIDALFTAAQYQLVSMALNSLGVQLDPLLKDFLPTDLPQPRPAGSPTSPRLSSPRVKPLTLAELSPPQRELVAPQIRDGELPNLYATMINHPKFYEPRARFGSYLQRDSHLPAKTRELLILRTAWLSKTAYEWSHHVSFAKNAGFSDEEIAHIPQGAKAAGWSAEQVALLNATDELRRETFISNSTWKTLAKHYTPQQLLEIIFTVGGYAMTGVAINSLGIQVEKGYPSWPSR